MTTEMIVYRETGYFSQLICDYLDGKKELAHFYNRFPELDAFKGQLEEKSRSFSGDTRNELVQALQVQYKDVQTSESTAAYLELLAKGSTFTITTGHQLNLFTGPLYFLYKIISTINLAKQLKAKYPKNDFVPIYWMATEDHDFEEINYFRFQGKKVQWNREAVGAVGELDTEGLEAVRDHFCAQLGTTDNAVRLCKLFQASYLENNDLTAATRHLANALFKDHGLVIVDGNDSTLKKLFTPYVKRELLEQNSFDKVKATTAELTELGYAEQVHPREINLFYLKAGLRERILKLDGKYFINETKIEFSEDEILTELEKHPERFSPNALLRPLFQEVILPNLCYIGGGGELAYWFQLKDYFKDVEVPFPILLLRNSALLRTLKEKEKAEKLNVETAQLFIDRNDLINRKIRKVSNIDIDFSPQKEHLVKQFEEMYSIAEETDASFLGAVKAQEVKQLKGLDNLEKRLLKAQKKKLGDHVTRLAKLQECLFPEESLQERNTNFADFYLEYGEELIPSLIDVLDPLDLRFTVITL